MLFGNSLDSEDRIIKRKSWPLILIMFVMSIIITIMLFYIQVLKYGQYLSKSDTIRIKSQVIEAPRGIIYDRNGEILAENRMSYSITIDPFEKDNFEESISHLAMVPPTTTESPVIVLIGVLKLSSSAINKVIVVIPKVVKFITFPSLSLTVMS